MNGKSLRHVSCPAGQEDLQCGEFEIWEYGLIPLVEEPDEEDLLHKIKAINIKYYDAIGGITKMIPDFEQATWLKQEQEARAGLLDSTAHTPLIDAMVESRGDTKEYLVGKIIEKADLYAAEVGRLLGEKQRLEKELIEQYKEEI